MERQENNQERGDYSGYTVLRVHKEGGVAEVVLNRAKQLNTMTPTFFKEVGDVFRQLDADDQVNVVLIWSESRLFSAGLDLKAAAGLAAGADPNKSRATMALEVYKVVQQWQNDFTQIEKCRKPVIAAVHGACIGGAVDLITACDIRLCTEDATFSVAETRLAIVADIGTLQRLSKIVGKGFAREMAYTADSIDAKRAHHHGLVNSVFKTKEELLEGARAMAKRIAGHSPLVVQGTKRVLQYSEEHTTDEGLQHVALWNSAFLHSEDLTEAVMAFIQKRNPTFVNRL
jgi:enoyl-CoA hydratase/carnithine racemase